ncbi:matrix metalloproteinase-17 [Cephus cinctus]|uniref:Matrix metalloproteinase-17 n=1 Tax=Cephus cinctus TaxID=211228 RepID=A0AAJ7W6G1_CEPCN|nr:matrix metalloproteinase-17 [Cephus cinctus]
MSITNSNQGVPVLLKRYWILLMISEYFSLVNLAPILADKDTATDHLYPPVLAFKFMKKFGYLEAGTPDSEALYTVDAVVDALKNVQYFGNIPITGVFDNTTLKLMESPRCGVADVVRHKESRTKRYIIGANGWNKRDITYFIANWTPKLSEEAVSEELARAFHAWSGYARLKFRQVYDPTADIIVAFGRGPHGDGYPFDGNGNVLAHAFFPYEMGSYGGDIHFDDDENWKMRPSDPYDGTDFFSVAVHELGHSLGLSHSPVPTSIMFPYYQGYTSNFQLSYDDILGMYQLYITRTLEGDQQSESVTDNGETETETEDSSTRYEETTESGKTFDTTDSVPVTTDSGQETINSQSTTTATWTSEETSTTRYDRSTEGYLGVTFTGDYETVDEHRRHENRSDSNSIPDLVNSSVPDICQGSYDAITVLRDELFIFKGEFVWRLLKRGKIDNSYPVKFHQLFYDLPEDITRIDAAYERQSDANIILFTGNRYWVYNGDKFVDGSPRPLTDYGISPDVDKIDAVQVWNKNKKVYLYRHNQFWRFNETSRTLDPGYPHNMRRWRGVPPNIDAAMTWIDGNIF